MESGNTSSIIVSVGAAERGATYSTVRLCLPPVRNNKLHMTLLFVGDGLGHLLSAQLFVPENPTVF